MRVSIILISALALLIVACADTTRSDTESPLNGEITRDPELVSQINTSPNTVTVNDVEYSMESYAWRDFMPIVNPPVRLNTISTVIRTDETAIQDNIEIVQHYIVKGDEIWIPQELEARQNQSSPDQLDIVSRKGPTWQVGSEVTIGLKFRTQATSEVYVLSTPNVLIAETQ